MDHYRGVRIGIAIECENGYFAGGGGGGWTYDRDGKRVKQFAGSGGDKHVENFIKAVRSRKTQQLRAPVSGGHTSSALCHLATSRTGWAGSRPRRIESAGRSRAHGRRPSTASRAPGRQRRRPATSQAGPGAGAGLPARSGAIRQHLGVRPGRLGQPFAPG